MTVIPKERRGESVSVATNKQATLEEFLEVMFHLYIVYISETFIIICSYEL
jgi:hypothetical protein